MLKRALDVLVAGTGLLLLAPLFAVLAVLIKLDSPGPVFFRQERVGRGGVPFRIFKFRTMVVTPPQHGPQVTAAGDPRVTRVGAVLRRTKLDELAQLIDVLRGTMSLVGPRPEVPRYVAHYPPEWRERLLSVRPGITDFASVRYHRESELLAEAPDPEQEYLQVVLPSKLRYALQYVDNPSLAQDLHVLGLTLRTVVVPVLPSPWSLFNMKSSRLWPWLDRRMSAIRPHRRAVATAVDALLVLGCWHLTYLFRLGFERWQPGRPWYDDRVSVGVVLCYVLLLAAFGVPRGLWRFFGFDEFRRIGWACALAGLLCAVGVLLAGLTGVARAVLVLHPVFCLLALCLARMGYRMVWEQARSMAGGIEGVPKRAIVLGAGDAARHLVSAFHRRDGWNILALLDDDTAKHGLRIGGVMVHGPIADLTLPHLLDGATHVIVAMPGVPEARRRQVIEFASLTGLTVLSIPSRMEAQAQVSPAA